MLWTYILPEGILWTVLAKVLSPTLTFFFGYFVRKPFEEWRDKCKKRKAMYAALAEIELAFMRCAAASEINHQLAVDNFYDTVWKAKYDPELVGAQSVRHSSKGEAESFEKIMRWLGTLPDSKADLIEKLQSIIDFGENYSRERDHLKLDRLESAIRKRAAEFGERDVITVRQSEDKLDRSIEDLNEFHQAMQKTLSEAKKVLSDVDNDLKESQREYTESQTDDSPKT